MIRKNYISDYLAELQSFTGKFFEEAELETNETIFSLVKEIPRINPCKSERYDFSDKAMIKMGFLDFFNSDKVIIWTPRSFELGYIVLDSVSSFDFSFNFDANREGIVSILSEGLKRRVVLDFFCENDEKKIDVDYFIYE
jgi:hypothetical protein